MHHNYYATLSLTENSLHKKRVSVPTTGLIKNLSLGVELLSETQKPGLYFSPCVRTEATPILQSRASTLVMTEIFTASVSYQAKNILPLFSPMSHFHRLCLPLMSDAAAARSPLTVTSHAIGNISFSIYAGAKSLAGH